MARVTVEDCIDKIPNRFDLVLAAAQRARHISTGNPLTIDRDNDKNPVVALREIADETIDPDKLRDDIVNGLQKLTNAEFVEDEGVENFEDNGLENMNPQKLFNYTLQNLETSTNILILWDILRILRGCKTKLVLYTYDSFLLDLDEKEDLVLQNIRSVFNYS